MAQKRGAPSRAAGGRAQQFAHVRKETPSETSGSRISATVAPPVRDALTRLLEHAEDPLQGAVLTRWLSLAADVLDAAPTQTLGRAASASSDLAAVLASLEDANIVGQMARRFPALTTARIRGIEARQQLLTVEGGVWTVNRVAEHLHLTRQAVDHRRRAGKLVALAVGRHGYLYPAWQFASEGTLPGLEQILTALEPRDPWGRVIFLLSPHPDLAGQTPLQALRDGRIAEVTEVAQTFAEHGQS